MTMAVNWGIVGATILPNVGGVVNRVWFAKSEQWYKALNKPKWTPPGWVFGPAWTSLYTGMGYASYLVYRDGGGFHGAAELPLIAYGVQLAANWAWTPIFFGCRQIKLALFDLSITLVTATTTGYLFYQVNHNAGYLYIPYLMWLSFATALNYRVYADNKDVAVEGKGN